MARRVDAAGAELACWSREGAVSGRWLVMIHGAGLDHREFLDVLDGVDESWGVLLFDLRGHGSSRIRDGADATLDAAVGDVEVVLRAFEVSTCVLVGHSFGGNVAQEYTHRHPERVSALVMVGSPGQHRILRRGELPMMRMAGRIYNRLPWRAFSSFSGRWSSAVPATREYVRDCLVATGRSTYIALGLSGFEAVHPAPHSTLPTLLMRGADDMPRALDTIYSSLEQSGTAVSRAIIPGVGHQVMQDDPNGFVGALHSFIDSHPELTPEQ